MQQHTSLSHHQEEQMDLILHFLIYREENSKNCTIIHMKTRAGGGVAEPPGNIGSQDLPGPVPGIVPKGQAHQTVVSVLAVEVEHDVNT